jgi:hypothetical protein
MLQIETLFIFRETNLGKLLNSCISKIRLGALQKQNTGVVQKTPEWLHCYDTMETHLENTHTRAVARI